MLQPDHRLIGLHLQGDELGNSRLLAQAAATRALGRRFGLVTSCHQVRWEPGMPQVSIHIAAGPRRTAAGRFDYLIAGTGVSIDAEDARLAAISETVERYGSMSDPVPGSLVRAAYRELGEAAVAPTALGLLSPAQYRSHPRLAPLADVTPVDWCWAFSLTRRCPRLVPAALVYFNLVMRGGNNFLPELTSSGTACHVSLSAAILAGLREVMERDALMVAWLNRLPLTRIDPRGTAVADRAANIFASLPERRLTLYDLPTDSPFPIVLAVSTSAHHPHAVVGAACRGSYESAAMKAIYEVSQLLYRFRDRPPRQPDAVRQLDDHCDAYACEGGDEVIGRCLGGGSTVPISEVAAASCDPFSEALSSAVTALESTGLEVLVVDLTPSDVAFTGFRVVRVIVPGAVDMNIDSRFGRLGARRIYELPVRLGLKTEPYAEPDLNMLPVPLA